MNPASIHKEVEIAAPPSQVWRFIGTADGLSQWWGVDVSMEERNRGNFTESGLRDGRPYRIIGEVTTYDPPRQLSIRLHDLDAERRVHSQSDLEITLEEDPQGDGKIFTRVSVLHSVNPNETDALSAERFAPVRSGAPDAHGPAMILPRGTDPAAHISITQPARSGTFTQQDLNQWRHQQEQRWHSRFSRLANLSG